MMTNVDNRQYPRLDTSIPGRFRTETNGNGHSSGEGTIRNISQAGLLMETDSSLSLKRLLRIEFSLDGQDISITTFGMVMWNSPNSPNAVGVQILAFDTTLDVKQRFHKYIEENLASRSGSSPLVATIRA